MKASEAPEKLYILFNLPYTVDYTKLNKRRYDEEVEYTRTDAFIEKAKEFLWSHIEGSDYHVNYVLNEFEKYMKGE